MASSLILLTMQASALDDPLPCHRENPQLWFSDRPADGLVRPACRRHLQNLQFAAGQLLDDARDRHGCTWPGIWRGVCSVKRALEPGQTGERAGQDQSASPALLQPLRQSRARHQISATRARSAWWPAGHRAPTLRPRLRPAHPSVTCTIGASSDLASLPEHPVVVLSRPPWTPGPDPGGTIVPAPSRKDSTRIGHLRVTPIPSRIRSVQIHEPKPKDGTWA